MHQVIVRIKPNGQTEVKANGYQGPTCTTVTDPFIRALGQKISDTPLPEMYQTTGQEQETQQ
jgi:Protein of unknown function (DUF2997)